MKFPPNFRLLDLKRLIRFIYEFKEDKLQRDFSCLALVFDDVALLEKYNVDINISPYLNACGASPWV